MIQIKETDFLWKCYRRLYRDEINHEGYLDDPRYGKPYGDRPPHPRSVCTYFWAALGGMCVWLALDSSVLIIGSLLCACCVMGVFGLIHHPRNPNFTDAVIGLSGMMLTLSFIFAFGCRFSVRDRIAWVVLWVFLGVDLLISLDYCGDAAHPLPWEWVFLWYGLLWELAAVASGAVLAAAIYGLIKFFDTSTADVVFAYAKSLKNRACPLVRVPWEDPTLVEATEKKADHDSN